MELKANIFEKSEPITMSNALAMTREWADKNIELAYQNTNTSFSILLLLAIIDCFAQAEYDYPPANESKSAFKKFVLSHSKRHCDALNSICPVTLYYDCIDAKDKFPLSLKPGRLYLYDDEELSVIAEQILYQLPESQRNAARKRHQYIELLYRLRSKLVHELHLLGTPVEFVSNMPCIVQGIDRITKDAKWTVRFPKDYVHDLTIEVLSDRLSECVQRDILPFPLSEKQKRCELSWYDAPLQNKNE